MIDWIELKNFQKWENLRIEFREGVNVLSGRSGIGKSALIRAMVWCIFNKTDHAEIRKILTNPDGTVQRNKKGEVQYTKETSVSIGVDGHVITRAITPTLNSYKLDDQVFTAFGRTVPEPISKLFNISDLSVQEQFDSLFLVSDTSGSSIAKTINSYASLDIMDKVISSINQDIKLVDKQIVCCEQEFSKFEAELNKLDKVDPALLLWKDIKRDCIILEEMECRFTAVSDALKRLVELQKVYNQYKYLDAIKTSLMGLEKQIEAFTEINTRFTHIQSIIQHLTNVPKIIIPDITDLSIQIDTYKDIMVKLDSTKNNITGIENSTQKLNDIEFELKNIQEQLDLIKICPLCERPMEVNHEVCRTV